MRLLISFPSLCKPQPSIFPTIVPSSATRRNRHLFIPSSLSMESTLPAAAHDEIAYDYSPFLRVYKDGHVERIKGAEIVPPSLDSKKKVRSKDVLYSPEANLFSRLYLPENVSPNQKLPLMVYFHGGGFCVETPYSPVYHNFLNNMVAEANIIAVSVGYRRVPEHPLPIAYEDSWTALKWVASHSNGDGPEEWLNSHADFGKVVLAGDSAGANIAHHISLRYGEEKLTGINAIVAILIHPYFWGKEPIGNEPKELEKRERIDAVWRFACPTTSGSDDPLINPVTDPKLGSLGCSKVLVIIAGKDLLRDRGLYYCEKLKESGWAGEVEIMEATDEGHVFHLDNSTCANAAALQKRIASFINGERA